jgi:CRP/FNR family transcriptional regulator
MNERLSAAVSRSEFFRGLSPEACRQMAALGRQRTLRKRETLFFEQTRGTAVFVLLEGAVGLTKSTPEGSEIVVRTVRPGETFGEVILFEEDRYPVTATALTPARVLSFARTDILRLLEHPAFRREFIALLMRKQRYLAERVRYLTAYDVEQRLLIFLREQHGEQPLIVTTLSKKDIAAAIGTTPETLSRLLQRLRREKLLDWKGRSLRIQPALWKRAVG